MKKRPIREQADDCFHSPHTSGFRADPLWPIRHQGPRFVPPPVARVTARRRVTSANCWISQVCLVLPRCELRQMASPQNCYFNVSLKQEDDFGLSKAKLEENSGQDDHKGTRKRIV
ncbi:triple QxxK/R motif-containing protein isoform X1 [Petaurus breviceps papuanus]|uniref:triple QxxK/R motif-containing protein isoform X1 n=1 Tax=Petaurus breviceps papuanus TaxID=3040969 RepID=UPI0036D99C27